MRAVCGAGVVLAAAGTAAGQLRVAEWNVTNYSASSPRDPDFRTALYGVGPGGRQFAPDILLIQEVIESGGGMAAVNSFLDNLNLAPGSPGDWAAAPYVMNGGDTGNAMFYRTSKVVWLGTVTLSTDTGTGPTQAPRDTQRWQVRMVGYSGIDSHLYLYGAHFKAGATTADQLRREPEGQRIRIDANALDDSANFMVLADMNVQCSCQEFYQYMVGNSGSPAFTADLSGRFFDPINTPGGLTGSTDWENNFAYRFIHTQDPTGPMDSRHDQILFGANLRDGQGMDYLPASSAGGNIFAAYSTSTWDDPNHSYRAWGNDGSSYNTVLNTSSNAMVGNAIAQALVNSAANGGHLPVYLDLQVPAKISAPASVAFGNVNLNSVAQMVIQISNGADVALWSKDGSGWGIDALNYSMTASSGFTAPVGNFVDAPGGGTNSHTITMNTSTPGPKSGTLTIISDDPDTPVLAINLSGVVGAAYDYDVDDDGLVNIQDLHRWYGLFTDVDGSGTVTLDDVTALRAHLRSNEVADMTAGRR